MNFNGGYDYEEVDRAYLSGMNDGGDRAYDIGYKEGYCEGFQAAIKPLMSDTKWINTKDRLPEDDDAWVLGLWKADTGRIIPDTVPAGTLKRFLDRIPYWMPIPKLPEVEG